MEEATSLSVSSGVVSYSAESVKIKAQADMRVSPSTKRTGEVSWDFQVIGKGTIGFAIGKLMPDGQVPLLTPYIRTQKERGVTSSDSSTERQQTAIVGLRLLTSSLTTIVVFFDNTFSWINPKNIKYNITVENFQKTPI